MVLDIDYSSTKHRIYLRERASRHAYYLRPPEGMTAHDLKGILDEAGGEDELGFRYYVYPELDTDLKPLLGADLYAGKYFERDDDRRLLQIEGERPMAREAIARLLNGLKQPFDPEEFPRINEFELESYRPAALERPAEIVLLRRDRDKNELRKSEPGFHIAIAEHGFAREIQVHRPVLAETEPMLTLNTTEHTGELGHQFLADMASYFGSQTHIERAIVASEESASARRAAPPSTYTPSVARIPRIEPPKVDGARLLALAAGAMRDQFSSMKLLRKRESTCTGPHIVIQFPGFAGFGKGPSPAELKELRSIYRATKGDPSFGPDWHAYYQIDGRSGEVRVVTAFEAVPPTGWTALRE
jgi:hypothetical protein